MVRVGGWTRRSGETKSAFIRRLKRQKKAVDKLVRRL